MALGQRMTVMRIETVDRHGIAHRRAGRAGAASVKKEACRVAAELRHRHRAGDAADLKMRSCRCHANEIEQAAFSLVKNSFRRVAHAESADERHCITGHEEALPRRVTSGLRIVAHQRRGAALLLSEKRQTRAIYCSGVISCRNNVDNTTVFVATMTMAFFRPPEGLTGQARLSSSFAPNAPAHACFMF